MKMEGVQVEPCPAYKHSMNGVVERAMYTIDCKIRSMIYQAKLPKELWCLVVEHAVWLKNRIPIGALPFGKEGKLALAKTPYEAYRESLPDFTQLRVFGCAAWPNNSKDKHLEKFDPRIKPDFMFIGLAGNKIYKLLNMITRKVEKYGDADFDEYSFPYSQRELAIRTVAPVTLRGASVSQPLGNTLELRGAPLPQPTGTTLGLSRAPTARGLSAHNGRRDRTVDADESRRARGPDPVHPEPQAIVASTTSNPHSNSMGGSATGQVFSKLVVQLVCALKAVHLEPETSGSLGAPAAPFEVIELRDALKEDAPGWREAILAEARSLQQMNTFTIMWGVVPNGKKLISSRWVLKKKFNSRMHLVRKKARLVIRGNEQQAGIDYFETFASVLRYTTLRILLAKAAAEDLEADHVDIDIAFLNPDLEEEVYMKVPEFLN
jgi:hypothetical protein